METLQNEPLDKKAQVDKGRQLRNRENNVLFMDLRTWNDNIEVIEIDKRKRKRKVAFTDEHIEKIKEIYNSWQEEDSSYVDVPELCESVMLEGEDGIKDKDYSFNLFLIKTL